MSRDLTAPRAEYLARVWGRLVDRARDEAERERAADQARLVAGDYRDPTRSGIGPRAPALRRHTRRRAAAPAPCAPRAISSPRPRCGFKDKASAARLRSMAEIRVRHLADKVAGLGGRRAAPSIGCRACWRRRHRARLSLGHGRAPSAVDGNASPRPPAAGWPGFRRPAYDAPAMPRC